MFGFVRKKDYKKLEQAYVDLSDELVQIRNDRSELIKDYTRDLRRSEILEEKIKEKNSEIKRLRSRLSYWKGKAN